MVLKVARLALTVLLLIVADASAMAQSVAPVPSAATAKPARPPLIPTTAFTEESGLANLTLSPDGKNIALKATDKDGKVHLAIMDAQSSAVQHHLLLPDKNSLEWFQWAGNRRVLVSLSQPTILLIFEIRFTRLFVYDLDTRKFTPVGKKDQGFDGDDVLYTDPAGQFVLLSMQRSLFDTPGVWRFPLDGTAENAGTMVIKPKSDIWAWFADDTGVVRMGLSYNSGSSFKVYYRRAEGEEFKQIAKITKKQGDDAIWDVVRIISGSDEGYVIKPDDKGQLVLRKFNYATRTPGDTVFAAPDGWDLTDFALGDDDKPVSASYTDDHDRTVWFDPKVKSVQARLERALGG
jgi:hypothetical protein